MGVSMDVRVERAGQFVAAADPCPGGAKFSTRVLHEMADAGRITFALYADPEECGAIQERTMTPTDIRLYLSELIEVHDYAVPTDVIDLLAAHEADPSVTWKIVTHH